MTRRELLVVAEEARAAVQASLPLRGSPEAISSLAGLCAVVAVETARRLELRGRRPLIEYKFGAAFPMVDGKIGWTFLQHFWVSCDGWIVDGTAKQLGGPLVYVSRKREQKFFEYDATRSWRTPEAVARFLRKLGWTGPSAALLVQERRVA